MIILGVNAFHADASACIVREGTLIAAAEEERFRRIKHFAGFPIASIRYCLAAAGIGIGNLDVVAVNQDDRANLRQKISYALKGRPDLRLLLDRVRNRRARTGIVGSLSDAFPGEHVRASLMQVEHHLAHLGSAFLVSPFEEAVALSVDGFGDFASAAWGLGRGNRIEVDDKVYFPHSLGIFYQALTQYLGFHDYGDEYKVMGLAPYGEPRFMDAMRKIVMLQDDGTFRLGLEYFRHHREQVGYEWDNGEPKVGRLYTSSLVDLLGPVRAAGDAMTQRHKDIASSTQAMYEQALFHLLNRLHARYAVDALALSGGCAMNSAANGKVLRSTPFRRMYVPAAAGDAGGAIGAAFIAWHRISATSARFDMEHANWGPAADDGDLSALVEDRRAAFAGEGILARRIADEGDLVQYTASAIAQGRVVGWFQGRMEWGPRALGNRSILADPRRPDMQEIINARIKRRESFRPFAPSILREAVSDWFEVDCDVPFMTQVVPVREAKRALIPAVTHVDGTGRLQTVGRQANPRYHRLIEAFSGLTGVPLVLNTSFNENEPVVCRPQEAVECFIRTDMDVLVLGDWFIERPVR